jgi:adenylylsulfate kinase
MEHQKFIVPHAATITKKDRQTLNENKSAILWYTGLSGSGKSTLANKVEEKLFEMGLHTYVLDGDNIRMGLNKGLGFTAEDRTENIRRIGEVAKLFVDAGVLVSTAFISPYTADRNMVRSIVEDGEFIEILLDCPIETCEKRDVKGLYQKARAGIIKNFTGVSDPYEAPVNPEIIVKTGELTLEESAQQVIDYLIDNNYIQN